MQISTLHRRNWLKAAVIEELHEEGNGQREKKGKGNMEEVTVRRDYMEIKRDVYDNPSGLRIMTRSTEGHALMKVALQADRFMGKLRFKASPADKQKWEQTSRVMDRLQEIIIEFDAMVREMQHYKGKVTVEPYEIRDKEAFLKSRFSFAVLPKAPDMDKLYRSISKMDDTLYAYRTMHTSMDAIADASVTATNALRMLHEYTTEIADIGNDDYTIPNFAERLLGIGEEEISDRPKGDKRKKKEKVQEPAASHENIGLAAQAS
ncbi:MAG: hypothetical protein ABFD82_04140 [Syntrophaceae bacterium]